MVTVGSDQSTISDVKRLLNAMSSSASSLFLKVDASINVIICRVLLRARQDIPISCCVRIVSRVRARVIHHPGHETHYSKATHQTLLSLP